MSIPWPNSIFRWCAGAFDFPDKAEGERWLAVEFANGVITRITDRATSTPLTSVRLEPMLIDRLLSAQHEDREFLPLEDFPEAFKDTLLLVEDRQFYHHRGVSPWAILRALWSNMKAGRTVQGGSTLTQQLAKNVYLNSERHLVRKINEAFIALILDYRYSKDQLLEAYLNEVYLGQFHDRAIHGFGLASHYYFAKPVNELAPHEFAVLMAIIKGPSYYNPRTKTERVTGRRDLVLRMMFEHHLLEKNEYEFAVNQPLQISAKERFAAARFPAYMNRVKRELKYILRSGQQQQDGVRVFTSLQPRVQRAAQEAIIDGVTRLEGNHQIADVEAAMVSVNILDGSIAAMVGGSNVNYAGLNRAIDMRRNIGSLIKPAVYLSALDEPQSFTLASILADNPITLKNPDGQQWSPVNFDKKTDGQVTLMEALVRSKNIPTVNLGMALGLGNVASTLDKLGIEREVPRYPSMLLGALALSPLEVSQMYTTLASRGLHRRLGAVETVIGGEGERIWQRSLSANAAFEQGPVYLTNLALEQVAQTGTARRLAQVLPGITLAGKTGTTDELRDSWFSGYDNQLQTTVWVGKDDYSPVGLTGTRGAMTLFADMYQRLGAVSRQQVKPDNIEDTAFSPESGYQYDGECDGARVLPAIKVTSPTKVLCED